MVRHILTHIHQRAAAVLNRIRAGMGLKPLAPGMAAGPVRQGRINPGTCFRLHSPPEKPGQEMPEQVRALHQACREKFYSGKLFTPLGESTIPGAVIDAEIRENRHGSAHILTVFPCGGGRRPL